MAVTHLDAGAVIGLLDDADAHHVAAVAALRSAQARGDRLAMAASAYAECLVGPAARSEAAVAVVQRLVERLPVDIVPLDEAVARRAAGLRAKHSSLKLPDALVVATAIHHGATRLVTTDRGWPTARALGLRLDVL